MFDPSSTFAPAPLDSTDPILPLADSPTASDQQTPAGGLTFQFDFDNQVPEALRAATYYAADSWSSILKDDIVLRLRIESVDLSEYGDLLGGARPGRVTVKYEDYVDALFEDITSNTDLSSVNSLQLSAKGREDLQAYQAGEIEADQVKLDSKEFAFLMDGQFANGRSKGNSQPDFVDSNGNNNNKKVQLTRAQAKALGLIENKTNKLDALVSINSSVDWDFDPTDGISRDRYDVVTVLQHEIGHALGIVSGIDTLEFLASSNGSTPIKDLEKEDFSYLSPMDFYRYSAKSAELGVMDLTIGSNEKYFSLDGGKTVVTDEFGRGAYFSTGSQDSGGDGYKSSHWKTSENPLGIADPVLRIGRSTDISQLDLTLLDSIGWDLVDASADRAAAIGIDWEDLTTQLASDRQSLINQLSSEWSDDIPAFKAALSEASSMLEMEFQQKLQKEFDDLAKTLEKETDPEKRADKTDKFYKDVNKLAEKRNENLSRLPKDIYKVDESVRDWLTLSTEKLSKEMQKADGATINRLSNIVKAMPAEERERAEEKLTDAAGLFADEPNKLVEDILRTSGPVNPNAWSFYRWYYWWLEAS